MRQKMTGYSIFGDSISTFRGTIPPENRWFYDAGDANGTGVCDPAETWWGRAIARNGGELVANASFSGAMVEGWGFPAGCSIARAKQIVGEDGTFPDVVLVYMGINDYGWGSAKAQAAGCSVASPANYDANGHPLQKPVDIDCEGSKSGAKVAGCPQDLADVDPSGMAHDDAIDNFQQAYEQLLSNIKEVAPDAEIHCLTLSPGRIVGKPGRFNYSLRGIELDAYNEAIKRACIKKGAICADVRAFGLDYSSIDGTHPDLVGMRQLADMYLASTGDEHALDDYESDMRSNHDASHEETDREKLIEDSRWGCYFVE